MAAVSSEESPGIHFKRVRRYSLRVLLREELPISSRSVKKKLTTNSQKIVSSRAEQHRNERWGGGGGCTHHR
jgi:hypothetical protein